VVDFAARPIEEREQRYGTMFEFGQALAMWLIDQGVTRDICSSALRSTWLERSADSSAALHSFFPSDAPGSSETSRPRRGPSSCRRESRRRSGCRLVHGVVLESKSRIRRSLGVRRASAAPGVSSKAWLVVTALGTLVSFSAAVAYSLSSGPKKSGFATMTRRRRTSWCASPRKISALLPAVTCCRRRADAVDAPDR